MLLDACKLPDMVLISATLDCFFDIFAEDFYNYALVEFNVIPLMAQGLPGLQALVSHRQPSLIL